MYRETIDGIELAFDTAEGLFSPRGLDAGTRAMLKIAEFHPEDKVLDLGCGYGPVGIYAAKKIGPERVTAVDVDPLAVETARKNAEANGVSGIAFHVSDGFRSIPDAGYTAILSNPPYQSDFAVARHFIEKGFNRLALGGRMYMVTKREAWYKNKFIAIFGGVRVREVDGYYVFTAEKRSFEYANKKKKT